MKFLKTFKDGWDGVLVLVNLYAFGCILYAFCFTLLFST